MSEKMPSRFGAGTDLARRLFSDHYPAFVVCNSSLCVAKAQDKHVRQ